MVKKGLIAVGTLVTAFAATVGIVMAQTATPSPTASSTTISVPSAAPATGMGD